METKNISFNLVSNNKCLLSHELLSFIFDYLLNAYLIVHNCGMTWRQCFALAMFLKDIFTLTMFLD